MKCALVPILAVLALAACSEAASEPTAVDTEALVATAAAWTPSDITRDLDVDDTTRQKIDEGLRSLHTSLMEMHERHRTLHELEGAAREAYAAEIEADMRELHAQHAELWDSLAPDVQEALATRLHERMEQHGEAAGSLHERMRRMHHDADDTGN